MAKKKVRVGLELPEEFRGQVCVHSRSVLLIFAMVMNITIEWGLINNSLYADDLISISESTENSRKKLFKQKRRLRERR